MPLQELARKEGNQDAFEHESVQFLFSTRGDEIDANTSIKEHEELQKSVVLREMTHMNDNTILDYRDFLNKSMERSRSIVIHKDLFIQSQGLSMLTPSDFNELGRHAHDDLASDVDEDPFFEYNQCQKPTKLELRKKQEREFQEIEIKRFFTRQRIDDEVPVNISEEIHRLVNTKYLDVMDEIVNAENLIDINEIKNFDCYTKRNQHLCKRSGIPNYDDCWYPLPPTYFETQKMEKMATSLKRIAPQTHTSHY